MQNVLLPDAMYVIAPVVHASRRWSGIGASVVRIKTATHKSHHLARHVVVDGGRDKQR